MNKDSDKVEEILDELDLDGSSVSNSSNKETQTAEDQSKGVGRLETLREAGAITDEEYRILRNQAVEDGEAVENGEAGTSLDPVDFEQPLTTSEGTDMDFAVVGVFEDINTSRLTMPEYAEALDEEELPSQFQGGPGRTLVCWQIHHHSNREIKLKHKHFDQIGTDQIAYNRDGNPLQVDRFGPGWRTDNWVDIGADTRVKYVSGIEIPNQLSEIKINGYCSDVHTIEITDEMHFPKSELPVTIDL